MSEKSTIKVTVHKGHLVTIGERMYVEAVELIRELVNNAYDADATDVYVTINPDAVMVEDNGSGMNLKDLEQYFKIGSEEKRIHAVSPRFGRRRIGQFGIGKFSALAAAEKFDIETQKGGYAYFITFDKEEWRKRDDWELEIRKESASPMRNDGTKITLSRLKKSFPVHLAEKYLRQALPLRVKKFSVFLNGKKLSPKFIPGRTVQINIKTLYGAIEGEIIIASDARDVQDSGIECRVKQVLVRSEMFGLEKSREKGVRRIAGFVNADFLPVTSSRTDFVRDSEEFSLFHKIMAAELEKVAATLKKELSKKEIKHISRELKEILSDLRRSLELNPDFLPSGRTIAQRKKFLKKGVVAESVSAGRKSVRGREENGGDFQKKESAVSGEIGSNGNDKKEYEKPKITKPAVLKRIRVAKLGISVGVTSLGETGPEVLSEGNAIYINQDHPLYQKFLPKKDVFETHLLRLITQEVVLMKRLRLPASEAFEIQSKLLTDALIDRGGR